MTTNRQIARYAGAGYLVIFITGIFSNFFVVEGLTVSGNAAQTTKNIIANDTLFRSGIFSFVLMVIFDLFLAWALYILFKPVNKNLSLLSGWLRLINAAVFAMALYHLLNIVNMLQNPLYREMFTQNQLEGQVMLSLAAFNNSWLIGLVFFGLHLLLLGYLIYKSVFMPRFIGILLLIAAIGYLIDSSGYFMMSNYADYKDLLMMIVVIPGIVGELSLTFWLLFKNNKIPEIGY